MEVPKLYNNEATVLVFTGTARAEKRGKLLTLILLLKGCRKCNIILMAATARNSVAFAALFSLLQLPIASVLVQS